MRIGIDGRYAFRAQRRGIGEYVAQLLGQYAKLGDDEFVVYVDGPADMTALSLPTDRFRVKRLEVSNPLLFEEIYLPRAAAHDRLDLLHLTANYGPTYAPCPTVYTVQDLIEFLRGEIGPWQIDLRHRLGRAVRQRTLPRQARHARMVIVPSHATRKDVVRLLGVSEERIRVIPYGAPAIQPAEDVKDLRAELRGRGYSVPNRYLLAFAALDPRKNGEVVVDAFRRVVVEFPDAELWLVGMEALAPHPGYDEPWLRRFGYLPRHDVLDLLRAASAFVFPSKYEGFGFPALEAMAAGVPLIASSSSSIPEVVGDTGILFAPDDASALATGIRQILRGESDVETRRGSALQRAALFTWLRTAEEHLAVYRSVGGRSA